jgi:hypothetical protein
MRATREVQQPRGWELAGPLQVKLKFTREVSIEQIYMAFESYLLGNIVVFWPCRD